MLHRQCWWRIASTPRRGAQVRAVATAPTKTTPSEIYQQLAASGSLQFDDQQWRVVRKYLDKLFQRLDGYSLPVRRQPKMNDNGNDNNDGNEAAEEAIMVPRGLYLYGNVGTGKSMLMDLFYNHVAVERKRRVHFNKFMLEVHERLQAERQRQLQVFGRQRNIDLDPSRDVIALVANAIADESHLLCFDEFQVTDIADALIMRKLFGIFFTRGVVMFATSNTPPQELYKDGTNREYFLPFLQQLARHSRCVDIAAVMDYRTTLTKATSDDCFLFPLSVDVERRLDALLRSTGEPRKLTVPVMMGRELTVVGTDDGACKCSFDYLCNTEKGAADYKALAECFHTVILEGIPQLDMAKHDQARRFILLVDELYEAHTRVVCSSMASPSEIFQFDDAVVSEAEAEQAAALTAQPVEPSDPSQGIPTTSSWDGPTKAYNPAKNPGLQIDNLCALQDLKVAFKRTVSRMSEMQSAKYADENERVKPVRQERLQQVTTSK